jgi:hypothetical protein
MIAKLRLILKELAQPSAQKADWFAWAAAQMAHAMIGVVLAGALAFLLPGAWAFAIAAVGYAVAKELPDYLRAPGWAAARDCIQDAAFVAAGAALAVAIMCVDAALFGLVLATAFAGLALGVWARLPAKISEQ